MNNVLKYWPIIMVAVVMVASGATAQTQISNLQEEVKDLKESKEQQIRLDERTKQIQSDIKEIKEILKEQRK